MPVEHSPKGVPAHLPDAQAGGSVPTEDPATPHPTAVDATGGSSEEIPFVDESLTTAFWKMFVNELQEAASAKEASDGAPVALQDGPYQGYERIALGLPGGSGRARPTGS
ncbi:hypothetical protein PCANC_27542 [Puccinia coronata f. sp. avenae]|uniref:Uncharacterized protein n=1 Tax=Puccinia coronata f. sp. avenae TaxID=200324 RepID=A0A2N5SAM5_9BASI|nr:hypothetical protein PCANC_27542 [Puccinia coronata f. sp. avenae]